MAKAAADAEKLATSLRMQTQSESEEIKNRATREIDSRSQTQKSSHR